MGYFFSLMKISSMSFPVTAMKGGTLPRAFAYKILLEYRLPPYFKSLLELKV